MADEKLSLRISHCIFVTGCSEMRMNMKLSIDGIKDKTAWEEAGIKLPAYDVRKVAENTKASPVWVHFGIGNIFRIFIDGHPRLLHLRPDL